MGIDTFTPWLAVIATFALSYLVGSIPFAYIIVKAVSHEDITTHGTGNVGSMNVRRTTGSWWWFAIAALADGLKGLIPTLLAKVAVFDGWLLSLSLRPWAEVLETVSSAWWANPAFFMPMAAVAGAVIGHNYSAVMALIQHRFARTGKGLATGAGALLAYDWRYLVAVLLVSLTVVAFSRYMMAGQVAAAATLPAAALTLRSPDWLFALAMGLVVYIAHHNRFMGMLRGSEPRLYINDRMGPRG